MTPNTPSILRDAARLSGASFTPVEKLAKPVLRHRIIRNFHAESEKVTTDQIVDQLLQHVQLPKSGM